MGLDQFANARKGKPRKKNGVLTYPQNRELASWRKHPNLQGWMEDLYRSKGGTEDFNCVEVELSLEDLDNLEAAINGKNLPETSGFFFGEDADDHYKETDLQFIKDAKEAISEGFTVVYSSWW